jgi:group I intron endonuclease
MQRSYEKHGIDAFTFEVLELVPALADLILREQHWIDTLNATDKSGGYNVRLKAESRLGMRHSEEAKQRMRAASKHLPQSLANKAALLAANTGRIMSDVTRIKRRLAALGKTHGAAAREKIRIAHTGKTLSVEHRAKIAASGVGRRPTEETRAKLRVAQSNRPPMSEATREKIRHASLNMSAETKARMSAAQLGKKRVFTATHRANISTSQKGRVFSPSHIANLTEAQRRRRAAVPNGQLSFVLTRQ